MIEIFALRARTLRTLHAHNLSTLRKLVSTRTGNGHAFSPEVLGETTEHSFPRQVCSVYGVMCHT